MKNKVKKGLVVILALCMLLTMVPVIGASAAADLDVETNWRDKSISISGTLEDLAGTQASVFVMSPAFSGGFMDIFTNMDLVVAAGQVPVGAAGEFAYTCSVVESVAAGNYTIFVNGAAYGASFTFADATDFPNYYVKDGDTVLIPIIIQDCENLSGGIAKVNYDSNLELLGYYGADGWMVSSKDSDRFLFATGTASASGDVTVGYAIFRASVDGLDDVMALVSFDVEQAVFNSEIVVGGVEATPARINIEVDVLAGDVNLDGKVDLLDVVLLMQFLADTAGYEMSPAQKRAAEVTGNAIIDTADVVVIMQMCL